jgi:hypothetical protein
MKKAIFTLIQVLLTVSFLYSQVGVKIGDGAPDPSSMLDVQSNDRGFLAPRMTLAQRNAIPNPAEGLTVVCTNCGDNNSSAITIYSNGMWKLLSTYCLLQKPSEGAHVPSAEQIVWNWNAAEYATGYKWNIVDDYGSAIDMGVNTTHTETGLTCYSYYYSYVWAYNVCGDHSEVTDLYAVTLTDNPASPAAGTHLSSSYGIEWNWNEVPGATGYAWNYEDNYATAWNMGTSLTKTETGLDCNTAYISYVWAYSDCGVSASATLTQTTSACWECGDSFVMYHYAGDVAPVTKTVTYGTVTGIPGEPGKCWITQNLGADHQATAVNDATEASGGWYWQFNLKQGYQFLGTTLTPSWTITTINQISDWTANNDPCAIEIGAGFRIPTYYEWDNVNTAGGWTNWNGPWTSALKLHAAGYLDYSSGWLTTPGSIGTYWSSLGNSNALWGWTLDFSSTHSYMYSWEMAYGYSVRCIRDF